MSKLLPFVRRVSGAVPDQNAGTGRMSNAEKFISIEGIARRYPAPGGRTTTIFENLWLAMRRGEFVCMIGHSGCGKTTIWAVLKLALQKMGRTIVDHIMNPKSMPRHQLLGLMNHDTREF